MIKNNVGNLESQLRQLKRERANIDKTMEGMHKSNAGALNMDFFRMKKQRQEVHQQAVRLTAMINPDNIA